MANLILIRHGDALHPAEALVQGMSDDQRPLTDFGQTQALEASEGIKKALTSTKFVSVSSPYKRAHETIKIISDALVQSGNVLKEEILLDAIVPDGDYEIAASLLRSIFLNAKCDVLVVSHLPIISEIYCLLEPQPKGNLDFRTAEFRIIKLK